MKNILIFLLILCTLSNLQSYSQPNKRTNYWYFGQYAGVDFNSGQPISLSNGEIYDEVGYDGCASISDTNGNLLFYSDGRKIWNRYHQIMFYNYIPYFLPGTQGILITPKPDSDSIFYVFATRSDASPQIPLLYYTVNINLNNGLGGVISTDTLFEAWDAVEKITATHHKNKQDIWIITRKFVNDSYAAFLINTDGINSNPVLSPAPDRDPNSSVDLLGYMKISYNKKYLIACYYGGTHSSKAIVEVCGFNPSSGYINYKYSFSLRNTIIPTIPYRPFGCEFSPDSKYLYIAAHIQSDEIGHIFQYDMQYIQDSILFPQTAIKIGIGHGHALQLASDGKIYCASQLRTLLKITSIN